MTEPRTEITYVIQGRAGDAHDENKHGPWSDALALKSQDAAITLIESWRVSIKSGAHDGKMDALALTVEMCRVLRCRFELRIVKRTAIITDEVLEGEQVRAI